MNDWKDRLIAYVKSLGEHITIEDAESLIHDEVVRIKEASSGMTLKSDKTNYSADHFDK